MQTQAQHSSENDWSNLDPQKSSEEIERESKLYIYSAVYRVNPLPIKKKNGLAPVSYTYIYVVGH